MGGGEGGPLVGGSGKKITSMSQLVAGDRIFQLYKMNKAQVRQIYITTYLLANLSASPKIDHLLSPKFRWEENQHGR